MPYAQARGGRPAGCMRLSPKAEDQLALCDSGPEQLTSQPGDTGPEQGTRWPCATQAQSSRSADQPPGCLRGITPKTTGFEVLNNSYLAPALRALQGLLALRD